MPTTDLVCWKCGASVADEPLPFARAAECRACAAELHVCRMCEYFDTSYGDACREPVADPPGEKERANFCGYFRARTGAYAPPGDEAERARAELESLFGGGPARQEAPGGDEGRAKAGDEARRQLESLFGKSGD